MPSFAIGVVDPYLAPFGSRVTDDAAAVERQAGRFREAWLAHAP